MMRTDKILYLPCDCRLNQLKKVIILDDDNEKAKLRLLTKNDKLIEYTMGRRDFVIHCMVCRARFMDAEEREKKNKRCCIL